MDNVIITKRYIGAVLSFLMLLNIILVANFDNYFFVISVFLLGSFKLINDKFDFLKPSSGFLFPWILLFIFLNLNITIYTRAVDPLTLRLMCVPVSLSVIISSDFFNLTRKALVFPKIVINQTKYNYILLIGLGLFLINFLASGFLPLINSIQTGQSDYFDYGIKGLNGMFYAYANAFCLLAYALYLDTSNKKYLMHLIITVFIFLLCLTRQNIISAITEIFILHSFKRGLISKKKMLLYVGLLLFAFGAMGELRSGDIKEIMGLRKDYFWLPTSFIWVYSYGFFNVLNLDNLVTSKAFGLFDNSSISFLLPSFLRPKFEAQPDLLEVINFNISSYINPILRDWGYYGTIVFTGIIMFFTVKSYQAAKNHANFKSISIYCVLLFCALFSFFINFWFYLPIIFQIPFLILFNKYVFKYEKN
ncbi:O-antigen polymerase [Pedobacter mucosus]|uniref:O-antigen polymerase n=1 Tax=Pedobacter mucosus TaxID=2895286 RepID=UPI001EE40A8D|nr:O-antigen polymerase [Pedobacter mucosus]UKT63248.1 oligosaccharide repeat unit polymerase [Pedobacter mucosus]